MSAWRDKVREEGGGRTHWVKSKVTKAVLVEGKIDI